MLKHYYIARVAAISVFLRFPCFATDGLFNRGKIRAMVTEPGYMNTPRFATVVLSWDTRCRACEWIQIICWGRASTTPSWTSLEGGDVVFIFPGPGRASFLQDETFESLETCSSARLCWFMSTPEGGQNVYD